MRLGMILPVAEPGGAPLEPGSIAAGARRIEAAGFDGAWVFDAIGRGFVLPDPLTALAVAATATERVELGTCILQVPLRRPVELAHRVMTTHLVCAGRLVLGVGAGSTPDDFDAVGVPFEERFHRFAEALPVMRALWAGEQVGAARLTPWPAAAGGPPVLIGSWAGGGWIKRAAEEFDGWIASAAKTDDDVLAEGLARFRAAGGARAVVTNIVIDVRAGGEARELAAERLHRLAGMGFDDAVILCFEQTPEHLEEIRALL